MKIYQVHFRSTDGNSLGYTYYSNKRISMKQYNADPARDITRKSYEDFHVINVEISKDGILHALNTFASHPDNG